MEPKTPFHHWEKLLPEFPVFGSLPPTTIPTAFILSHEDKVIQWFGRKVEYFYGIGGLTWTEIRAIMNGYRPINKKVPKRKPDDEQVVRAAIAQWEASQVKHPESTF